ncbi:DUF269 domain-containing protein [Paenibacillus sp. FSL R5-0527]|uniref:DUF269 domain-containing protein n=1 Tax=Paenibacillus sp. FSL R5-0527 TaxID=2975321 RepID=UPI00097B1F49|nr:hypothetical protein BK140_13745 [Paenibacillus macerans]
MEEATYLEGGPEPSSGMQESGLGIAPTSFGLAQADSGLPKTMGSSANIEEPDRRLLAAFNRTLSQMIDAYDYFGKVSGLSEEEKIARLLLFTPEEKQALSQDCTPNAKLRRQVEHVFQALAAALEAETGQLMQSMVEMNGEGFGRAIVSSGRLILVSVTLRAGLRFPFTSAAKLEKFALSQIREALDWLARHGEVAAAR